MWDRLASLIRLTSLTSCTATTIASMPTHGIMFTMLIVLHFFTNSIVLFGQFGQFGQCGSVAVWQCGTLKFTFVIKTV